MNAETLLGRLATGIGQGEHFTQLDWARAQFIDRLGIDPYPGTVNMIVDDPHSMPLGVRSKALCSSLMPCKLSGSTALWYPEACAWKPGLYL